MAPISAVILCVDDEENPLVLRKLVLEKAGYKVVPARSAREALEIVATQTIDLVLTDHLMPGVKGSELARQIKAQFPRTRVVLLSGVNELPEGAEIADAFVSKVEGPDTLCKQIAAVLNQSGGQ